jgi:hypothetical protein
VRAVALLLVGVLAVAAACAGTSPSTPSPAAADVDAIVDHVRRVHPDPWHDVTEAEFTAAAADLKERLPSLGRDETLVELMRLVALLGVRDGHSGIFPLDETHRRRPRLYPVRLFAFADGVRVVGGMGDGAGLVGLRLVAVAGTSVKKLAAAVEPLVPADNDASRRARTWQWAVVAEVLHGLGVTPTAGEVTFRFARDGGGAVERTLAPVPAATWTAAFPDLFHPMVPQGLPQLPRPSFLARRNAPDWTAMLERGRVVYAAYNVTLGSSEALADRLRRLARGRAVRGIVLDLRHNPGGNNAAYASLLDALVALGRRERVVVLTSRTTFSAAANLLADLEARVPVRVVGEASGGSPNLVGDPAPLGLRVTGWTVNVGTVWWQKSKAGPDDPRLAFDQDVRVPVRWADLAAGRDRALEAAVAEAAA